MENGAVLQTLFDILKYFRIFTEYMSIFNYFFGSDLFSTGWRLCFDILLELISSEPKQEKITKLISKLPELCFWSLDLNLYNTNELTFIVIFLVFY